MENRNAKFTTIRAHLQRWLGLTEPVEISNTAAVETTSVSEVNDETHISNASNIPPAPYDPELLERSRMQWQFGDWNSLTKIDIDTLEHHPQRAKLALVVACAWQQLNDHTIARRFIKLAKEWGCDKKIMAQLLIAGVYNTLGRSAAIEGDETRAQTYFRLAVKGGGGDERLASHARSTNEISQLQQLQLNKQNQVTDGLLSPKVPADSQDSASTYENNTPPDVNDNPFRPGIVSYAQNFEDVMLWRALGHIEKGFYIDIGAQDPVVDSVSKAFYEHGWRGVHVEATPAYAEALRKNRPDELVIEAAVSDHIGEMTFYEIPETGLSTGDPAITPLASDNFYRAFEDRFRGPRDLIKDRVKVYLPFVESVAAIYPGVKALDLGCGRGEWLEVLQQAGIDCEGVDIDSGMLNGCQQLGLKVIQDDALGFLASLPDSSRICVSLLHVVEHIAFDDLRLIVKEAKRVLVPEGVLIMETPNPENYTVGACNFYMDPTHRNPLPPLLLAFVAEYYGFERLKIVRLNENRVDGNNEHLVVFDVLEGISPDYAVIAQINKSNGDDAEVWNKDFGISLHKLMKKYS